MKINQVGGFGNAYSPFGAFGSKQNSSPLSGQVREDRLSLSKQALFLVQKANQIRKMEKAYGNTGESSEEQVLKTLREAMEILKTCSKIAARVKAGDKVPLKDLRYLMKHDMRSYLLAMTMRKPKEDPKVWKSAIPKEDQDEQQAAGEINPQNTAVQDISSLQSAPSGGSSSSGQSSSSGGSDTGGA